MSCPYEKRCRRLAYSKYFQDGGSTNVPDCLSMVLRGFATADILGITTRIYAERFPSPGHNLCPAIVGGDYHYCHEYRKETKKIEKRKESKIRQANYPDSRRRVYIARATRIKVAKLCRYKCVYCGRATNQICNGKSLRMNVDHIIPLALGGKDTEDNLALSCWECNSAKGTQIWERGCRKFVRLDEEDEKKDWKF